ncbi:MAG TPA: M20/M25/M40 family metallo-hydrolase [Vicinamibacterales bacterium]|jgi:carboxypeptidase Q
MEIKRTPPLLLCAAAIVAALAVRADGQPVPGWINTYRDTATRLIKAATADDFAWQRLAELTDTFGNRLSGSDNLGRAIVWAAETMKKDGLENVRTEKVMVPKWSRGKESAEIVDPPRHPLSILGLGGSVATPPGGIEAEVLVVDSFNELRMRGSDAKGRIVLFNQAFTNYADTVSYRTGSARAAAQAGAVGVLVRSIGPVGLRTPHTGSVQYQSDLPQIPAAAISGEDANRIARLAARGRKVRIHLSLDGRSDGDAESANVVGEIRGRERPEEIVVLGGHLDSWDVGAGASDDGVGCVITWEALRLMKKLGIQPRRTVRLVLWTNEENGTRGAAAYAERYASTAMNHVFALEADSGVFEPARFGFSGSLAARNMIREITSLLAPLNLAETISGGGGADIDPIAQAGRAPTMAYMGDPTRYFTIHHTPADTVERIAPEEVSKGAAAIAVVIYVIAEMPDRLPR